MQCETLILCVLDIQENLYHNRRTEKRQITKTGSSLHVFIVLIMQLNKAIVILDPVMSLILLDDVQKIVQGKSSTDRRVS